jgi:hypothetical protein
MRRRIAAIGALALLALLAALLSGCGERVQTSDQFAGRRGLQPAWDAAANPFVVPGWKSGDQASWQAQMTKRAQNQNEYMRLN